MQKLILTSLGIVSISLLILNYTKKNIDYKNIATKSELLEKDTPHVQTEKSSKIITSSISSPKKLTLSSTKTQKNRDKELFRVSYLNYRKEQHHMENRKREQYLTHQKELHYIREGGLTSILQREKQKHEVQYHHQYISMMMSKKRDKEKSFMEHKQQMQKRREEMQSLKKRQILQTKYRGEL